MDASSLRSFESDIVEHKLEFALFSDSHLEDLSADIEDDVKQRCELLLGLLCHLVAFLADSLDLA